MATYVLQLASATDNNYLSQATSASYPVAGGGTFNRNAVGTTVPAGTELNGSIYVAYNYTVRWNTSFLVGAAINAAWLRFEAGAAGANAQSHNLVGDWNNWTGAAAGDFEGAPISSRAFVGSVFGNYVNGTTYDVALTTPSTYINRSGLTGIVLGTGSSTAPLGFGMYLNIISSGTSLARSPRLVVDASFPETIQAFQPITFY